MTPPRKKIVLDANILIRGVLGIRVPDLLERYHDHVRFYTPAQCFLDARTYLPSILNRRSQVNPGTALQALDALTVVVQSIDKAAYAMFEVAAKQRDAFVHPDEPVPDRCSVSTRGRAVAVVDNRDDDLVGGVIQRHVNGRRRSGVLERVGQSFLDDSIRGQSNRSGQRPGVSGDLVGHRQAGVGDPANEGVDIVGSRLWCFGPPVGFWTQDIDKAS